MPLQFSPRKCFLAGIVFGVVMTWGVDADFVVLLPLFGVVPERQRRHALFLRGMLWGCLFTRAASPVTHMVCYMIWFACATALFRDVALWAGRLLW